MLVNGVDVDFVGEYDYPFFLKKYKGYAIKVVTRISGKESSECDKLLDAGYLPLFILKSKCCNEDIEVLETEKNKFSFICGKLEIEKSIFSVDNFNGIIIACPSDGSNVVSCNSNVVSCNSIVIGDNKVVAMGISGCLSKVLESTLLIYNRRIV